jgi:hypothetical protein
MHGRTVAENVFKMSARVLRMGPKAMCGGDRSAELDSRKLFQLVSSGRAAAVTCSATEPMIPALHVSLAEAPAACRRWT